MGNYQQRATILFNSGAGGFPPDITATGHSTAFDTSLISDVALVVTVGGAPSGSSPTLVVGVDMEDAAGNWISQVIKTGTLNASGTTVVSGGLHGLTGNQIVLSGKCRVSWTVGGTGPTFPATQISLIGR